MPEQITEASASTPTLSANTDRVANSPATQCAMPHTALPSEMPPSDAIQSSPPALVHSKLPYTDAQTDSLPGVARPNSHRQGSNECGCLKQDSLTAADPRNSSLKNTSPELASPTMKAMQALDLASIMGAPAEMLGPILSRTEPLARQAHQASLAQQNSHGLHQIHTAPHTDLSAQQQGEHAQEPKNCCSPSWQNAQSCPTIIRLVDMSSLACLGVLLNRYDVASALHKDEQCTRFTSTNCLQRCVCRGAGWICVCVNELTGFTNLLMRHMRLAQHGICAKCCAGGLYLELLHAGSQWHILCWISDTSSYVQHLFMCRRPFQLCNHSTNTARRSATLGP